MRDYSGAAVCFRELYTIQSFSERSNLIYFDQDGVCDAKLNSLAQEFSVGHKQIIADELYARAKRVSQRLPSGPVVFSHAVFNRNYWIGFGPCFPKLHHLIARQFSF